MREEIQTIDEAVKQLKTLSPDTQHEIFRFIDFCRWRKESTVQRMAQEKNPVRKRRAGTAKGKVIFADDFDAPLEEFKDYR